MARAIFKKLYWAQGFLAAAYALSLAALLWSYSNQESAARHSLALAAYSQHIHEAALSCRRLLRFSRSKDRLAQATAARREASRRLAQTRAAALTEVSAEETAELDKLSRFVQNSGRLLERIDALRRRGRNKEAASLYDKRLHPLIERYVSFTVAQRLREERLSRLDNERSARLWMQTTFAATCALALLSCLLSLIWTWRFVTYTSENLQRITVALRALRSGRLRVTIEPDRADELGAICTSLKALAARLDHAHGRLDGVTELANETSRALNEVVFAVGEYVALARQKRSNDAQDEYGLNNILERVGRCNLLLGRLCESVAGQKLLAEQAPDVLKAIDGLSGALNTAPAARNRLN